MPLPMAIDLHASGFELECLMFVHRSGSVMVKNGTNGNIGSLKGTTFLVPSDLSVQHMLFHRLMAASGLSFGTGQEKDVTSQAVPPFLMPRILEMDNLEEAAGYIVAEPFGTLSLEKESGKILCASSKLWKDHPCCCFVMEKDFSHNQPLAMEEMVSDFFKSADLLETQIRSGMGPSHISWMSGFLDQAPEIIQRSVLASEICFDPEKLVPEHQVIDTIQVYMNESMGVLPQKIDLSTFINPEWAQSAISEACLEN